MRHFAADHQPPTASPTGTSGKPHLVARATQARSAHTSPRRRRARGRSRHAAASDGPACAGRGRNRASARASINSAQSAGRDVGGDRDAAVRRPPPCSASAVMSSPESWMKSGAHRVALARDAADVAGRVLHADDVLAARRAASSCRPTCRPRCARRDVVDEDRNPDGRIDRLEMLVQAFLVRLVVIWRHNEDAGRAGFLGMPRQRNRLPAYCWSLRQREPGPGLSLRRSSCWTKL